MTHRTPVRIAATFAPLTALVALAAGAAAGPLPDLDTSFAGDGIATTDFGGTGDAASGVAVQPDGKIVVVGERNAGPDLDGDDYIVVRYLPDGSLDPTFGVDGRVVTDFGGPRDEAHDVVLQPDGKIVAAGWSHPAGAAGNVSVARYLPDGTLDPTFDADGRVTVDLGGDDFAAAVALQPDGKVVLAGGTAGSAAVVRLTTTGAPDPTFSGDGRQLVDLAVGSGGSVARDVALGAGGAIVLGGARCNPTCVDFAAARLLSDGSLDTTFSGDGVAHVDVFSATEAANAVAVDRDDNVILAGFAGVDGGLARLRSDGAPDLTFGVDGRARVRRALGETVTFEDVIALPSGRILVGGSASPAGGATRGDLLVARFLSDGGHDVGFSDDGRAIVDIDGRHQHGAALALQPDGKMVLAGLDVAPTFDPMTTDVAVARFLPNGSIMPTPPGRIRSDQSDFGLRGRAGSGLLLEGIHSPAFAVGDAGAVLLGCDAGQRAVARFDLRELSGRPLRRATLTLTILQSRRDQFAAPGIDNTPPFLNPGLGAIRVVHIADQAIASLAAYGTPSIGDDPGVLVPAGVEPAAHVEVDVTAALEQRLAVGAAFAAFRIESEVETDGDCLNDAFSFWTGDAFEPELRPFVDYELGDVVPPVLEVPTRVDTDATSPAGATVDFDVVVRDETDPAPEVECAPAAGSVFAIGDTLVTCTATDASGNAAARDFVVHVRGPEEQLERLRARVDESALHMGVREALDAKLAAAERALVHDRLNAACAVLHAFERQLAGLDPNDGDVLAAASARVAAVLDCSRRTA